MQDQSRRLLEFEMREEILRFENQEVKQLDWEMHSFLKHVHDLEKGT